MITVVTPTIRPDGLKRVRDSLLNQSYRDFEWLVDINVTGEVDFNASMNKMLKKAKGELIVSLQDNIHVGRDGLQKFWDAYKQKPAFYTAPVGKVTEQGQAVTYDWRTEREDIGWQEWEIDWGCAPRAYLFRIGGFDEELDRYWGFDNVNVGLRAHMAGYEFGCLPNNPAIAIDHDALEDHPFRKLRNPKFHNKRLDDIRHGEFKAFI